MSITVADRELPLGIGIAAGVAANLIGYVLVFLFTQGRLRDSGLRQLFEALGGDLPTWKAVGWVLFNAHFVEIQFEAGLFGTGTGSFIGEDGFSAILYAVPPLVLIAAGLAVGQYRDVQESVAAATSAVGIVVGYFLLVVASAFLFQAAGGDAGPVLATSLLLAGLIYPAVFGTLGAFVATLTD